MKNLISQEEKNIIDEICKKYNINKYTINPDGSIDVNGSVNLDYMSLRKLPLKFGKVSGYFNCSANDLTTLEGCPTVVGGSFYGNINKLTSLEHCPDEVGSNFYCSNNDLTSLEHCPSKISGDFKCQGNKLTSLEHCPDVDVNFSCSNNELTSLEHCPTKVGGNFYCSNNELTSLEHCPTIVRGNFYCSNNKLTEEFVKIFDELSDDKKRIYIKYQDQMGVWYNGYDHEAVVEIIEEINTGLL
jgi:hypothetical protein